MKKVVYPKHLPIPLGLALGLLGLFGGVLAINQGHKFFSRATQENSPQQLKITNVTSSSFVVSWITPQKTTASLSLGETKELGEIRKDFRDLQTTSSTSSKVHFVLVDNLKPQTKYYFKIISGGRIYDNSGKPFEVVTAPAKNPPPSDLAFGKILTPDRRPAAGVIVYLSLANTLPQAALTDKEGNWVIPLSTARTPDLQDFSSYDREAQIEEIFVRGEEQTATATTTTGNDSPVPDIILGESYNFLENLPPLTPSPTPIVGKGGFTPPSPPISSEEPQPLTIIFPEENEKINTGLPEFLGTGPKDQKLTITVESEEKITAQTTVDRQGNWSWSPKVPLSPGKHRLTVSYIDNQGTVQKITRNFIVLATGESNLPSFTATPSGQKASPTLALTPTPKVKTSPSPTPRPTLTSVPTTPSPELTPPSSGQILPTKIFLGLGATIILIGAALLFH